MAKLQPRNIVITGASGGLGFGLASSYAQDGVVLGLVGRDERRLHACADACRQKGARVVTGMVDLRDTGAIHHWLETFDDAHPIGLLIANAGVASTLRPGSQWEGIERTASIVDTNFLGAMRTVEPVIARMRERRRGQIALISSLAALRGMAISPAYCASKAALKAWGDSVRPLLARDGVHLSVVLPGFVRTPMSDVFPGDKPFLWPADKAARVIRRQLAARRAEIAFPRMLALGMQLLNLLPAEIADGILMRMFAVSKGER